jgi:hypothetical protein
MTASPFSERRAAGVGTEYATPMIHPYDNASQTRWNRGELKVQLMHADNPRPMGFCDGSDEDVAELRAISEAEGADDMSIHRRVLKTGREIWTLGGR